MTSRVDASALRALAALVGERCSTRPADLEAAACDASSLPGTCPEAVVWPLDTDEVAAVVRLAVERGIPLTPRGAGSCRA